MYQYEAKIVRVIDGDTAVLDVDLGFNIWLHNIHFRFYGIDTPERGKEGWEEAKAYVENFFVANPTAVINVLGHDSFGRWLAMIQDPQDITLNAQLVKHGYAVLYSR